MSKEHKSKAPLRLFVHAERMSWDSKCVFLTAHVELPKDVEGLSSESVLTRVGDIRTKDLCFLMILEKGRPRVEGSHFEYRNVFSAELYDLKRMVRTLEAITRGMKKIQDRFGYHTSFSEWLRRAVDVLGIEEVTFSQAVSTFVETPKSLRDEYGVTAMPIEQGTYWLCKVVDAYSATDNGEAEHSMVTS